MRFSLAVLLSVFAFAASAQLAPTNPVPTVTVGWNAPTNFPASQIGGYKVYWGTSTRNYSHVLQVTNTIATIAFPRPPTITLWFLAATTLDTNTPPLESDFSSEITWTVQPLPDPASNVRVVNGQH